MLILFFRARLPSEQGAQENLAYASKASFLKSLCNGKSGHYTYEYS